MQMVAEKRVLELSEGNIETTTAVFLVQNRRQIRCWLAGETVEALLRRVGLTGAYGWHYDQAEVRIKLVKPVES